MGEHIRAGIVADHANGKRYLIIEVRQAGGRTVAVGAELIDPTGEAAGSNLKRNVVLAMDKLVHSDAYVESPSSADAPPQEVLGSDCTLTAQDMANLTGHAWEGCEPDAPAAVSCHVSAEDMANLTGNRWEDSFPTMPSVDAAHAEMMDADGGFDDSAPVGIDCDDDCYDNDPRSDTRYDESDPWYDDDDVVDDAVSADRPLTSHADHVAPTDLPPARPLAPNSDAAPITTDDLRQCRRELRRKVAIHCAGESRMTAGSLGVALRTLAALDRAITGETAPRPTTGMPGAFSGPSEPGPLGIYDRQGSPKRSRRRRRHEDKIRAPRSIFRARSDRKPRPSVHGGQTPRLGFSAN